MPAREQNFLRDLLISGLTVSLGGGIALAGWVLVDRIHWAAREQQILENANSVREIQDKVDALPNQFVSRQEFNQVQQLIQNDHADTINAINHLSDRVDRMASGRPRSAMQQPDASTLASHSPANIGRE